MIELRRKRQPPEKPDTSITLTLDQRIRSRLRTRLDDGRDAGILLERGTTLKDGDYLAANGGITVLVRAAPETLSVLETADPLLLARACYHLGNRHVALQIEPGRVSYLHDHVLDAMLAGFGLKVAVIEAPFEPEPGAYGGSAHGHSHGSGHGHHHD